MIGRLVSSRAEPLHRLERAAIRGASILFWCFLAATIAIKWYAAKGGQVPDFSNFLRSIGMNPVNASGFGAFALLYLCARPTRASMLFTLVAGLPLELYYHIALFPNATLEYHLMIAGPGVALTALVALLGQAFLDPIEVARIRARTMLQVAMTLAMYPISVGLMLTTLSKLTPAVWDPAAYMLENALGLPSQGVARWLEAHPELDPLFVGVYTRLPILLIGGFALNILYYRGCYSNLFLASVAGGVLSSFIYPLLPMVGISFYLGAPPYPQGPLPLPPSLDPVPAPPHLPRTCYPSMHGTWSLLPFLTLYRISPKIAAVFAACFVITLISALDTPTGHYILDLLVAFPFAVAMQSLATLPSARNGVWRRRCLYFGLGVTIGAALIVRWGTATLLATPWLFWLFWLGLVVCAGASMMLERRLGQITLEDLEAPVAPETKP